MCILMFLDLRLLTGAIDSGYPLQHHNEISVFTFFNVYL